MDIKNIAVIISGAAFLFTVLTYFSKKRNKEKRLIDYNLSKIEIEKNESHKAIIEANPIIIEGRAIIKIYNKGKSLAKNITVTFPDEEKLIYITNPFKMEELRPQNSFEITIHLADGHPDTIKLNFEWSDDFKERNKTIQYIQLT